MSAVTPATEVEICWSMQDPMPIRSTRVNIGFSPCFHLSVVLLEQLYRFCNWQWAVVKFYNTVRSCVRSCDGVQVFVQFSYEFEHLPTELRVIDVWKNVLGINFPSEKKYDIFSNGCSVFFAIVNWSRPPNLQRTITKKCRDHRTCHNHIYLSVKEGCLFDVFVMLRTPKPQCPLPCS
jgi:hypothetical protein